MKIFFLNCLICFFWTNIFSVAYAVDVNFRGTLQAPPPCTINNGNLIDVDFGRKVAIKKVDGNNFKQRLNYIINCAPGVPGWSLGLSFNGIATTFDSAAIQTNMPALGIRMLLDGKPLAVNNRVEIDATVPPVLEAVPVKNPALSLTDGAFEATATLYADYQ